MKKEMLINVLQSEECRIAIVEDGLLEELYVERASQESYVGNIYKGKIVNIEPGIQAAFVDFGIGRNGFLHLSDVDPVYYKHLLPRDVQAAMDAEDAADAARRSGGPRGDRRNRDRDGERPPRPAAVESSVTLPAVRAPQPPRPAPPAPVEEDDDDGFGGGLTAEAPALLPPPARPVEERREVPAVRAEAPPVSRPVPPPPPLVQQPVQQAEGDEDDGGFGAGLLDDEPATPTARVAPESAPELAPEPTPIGEPDTGWELVASEEVGVVEADAPADEPADEPKPKKPARARAKPKAKADDAPAAEAPEADAAEKKPARRRPAKKKADDGDDTPKPMPAAERRTTASDDEPEVRPFFFGGAGDDFDVDAPNDRFGGKKAKPPAQDEPAGFGGDLTEDDEEGDEAPAGSAFAVDAAEEDEPRQSGRSFEEEFGPPVRVDEPRRGGRNDRGGGGRGDRDRGPRTGGFRNDRGPERGPDRGPRPGMDRGGDRGPRPAPNRSSPPPRDRGYPRPPIQEIFKRGQEVIVQVIKEAIGTKAPNLSTFISIAGRYLVLMPSLNRVGVSRKIEDMDARRRLRDIMTRLNPPQGVGFIVRTAATERNEQELQNDLAYLLRLWQVVARRIKKVAAPVEIYRESDMITRTIRDNFTGDIDTIWVDEETAFAHASDFLQVVMPRFTDRIKLYSDTEPLFNKYRVDEEIAKINSKRIELPQGGSIIIEQTEALVAIDVNSGNFRADSSGAEETAFQINMIAAREIARQLRLRDLGGVIVNDFIDMRSEAHRRKLEEGLADAMKRDRARTKVLRISQFGIIEMTRQRIQTSLKKRIFNDCPHCKGTGSVKTNESMGIEVMRLLQLAAHRTPAVTSIAVTVESDVAFYLLNKKRKEIAGLEQRAGMDVQVAGAVGVSPDTLDFKCLDSNGNEVRLFTSPPPRMAGRGPAPRSLPDRRPPALD